MFLISEAIGEAYFFLVLALFVVAFLALALATVFFFALVVLVLRDVVAVFFLVVVVRRVVLVFPGNVAGVPSTDVPPAVARLREKRRVVAPFWCGLSSALRCGTTTSW
jgi:hypothetical protein